MARKSPTISHLRQIAKEQFGYSHLRPGQPEAVQAILAGHDTLAVMPTGSGKSAIYQLAASLMSGPTVVVSPLIALQRDQVKMIVDQDIGEAGVVNSALRASERQETLDQLQEGDLEFLFLAPEQFNAPDILERLQAANPSLFVVDEAHCISAWGHDFRPDYLRLGQVIEALGHPRILALTATAAPPVRSEIVERLGMQNPSIVVEGFDRPNIYLSVERFDDEREKQTVLVHRTAQAEKPGIIYAATRKRAEELAAELDHQSVRSHFYHAGMKTTDRQQTETAFMDDQIDVLVATTAFGMGVDKPNVRFVFHADISDSIDSYYQEIGRAGRDGEPATALLCYDPENLNLRRFFSGGGQVNDTEVKQILASLESIQTPVAIEDLRQQTELSKSKLRAALNDLADVEALQILPDDQVICNPDLDVNEITEAVLQAQDRRQQFERSRIEMMRNYAEVRGCRREYLLNYFGEKFVGPCGNCDNCKAGITTETAQHQPYSLDSRLIHTSWGSGTVMRYEGDKIVILFDDVGYKTLDIKTALLRRLLRRAESEESAGEGLSS